MTRIHEITGYAPVKIKAKWNTPLDDCPEPDWDKLEQDIADKIYGSYPYETRDDEVTVEADYDGFSVSIDISVSGTLEEWRSPNPYEYPDDSEVEWDLPSQQDFIAALGTSMSDLSATIKCVEVEEPDEFNCDD